MMLLFLLSLPAFASGFYMTGGGLKPASMGGAFVASADDLNAQQHNPAGLMRLQAPSLSAQLSGASQWVRFEGLDEEGEPQEGIGNAALPYLIPMLAWGQPLGDRAAWAFGLHTPYAPRFRYPEDGAQRFTMVSSTVAEASLGPSLAIQPLPWVSLGASAFMKVLSVQQELHLASQISMSGVASFKDEIPVSMSLQDLWTPSWNAGLQLTPGERWSLGVSYTPAVSYEARGPLSLDFTDNAMWTDVQAFTNQFVEDEDVLMALTMPQQLRWGVGFAPHDRLQLEWGGSWTDWSSIEELLIEDIYLSFDLNPQSIFIDEPGQTHSDDPIALPAGYQPSWAMQLGADWQQTEQLSLRAGLRWEQSAVPEETLSVLLLDAPKLGLSAGAGLTRGDWLLEAAALANYFFPQEVTESSIHQLLVTIDGEDIEAEPDIGLGEVVGLGRYRSLSWLLGIGVTRSFGVGS